MHRRSGRRSGRCVVSAAAACTLLFQITSVSAAPSGGALPPQLTLELQIAGVGGVPADAVGVALNVTVTNPLAAGFLTVYPCGDRPLASSLNYVADQTVPNFVIAALDEQGAVCIDTMTVTDVVVDLAGYLPAGSDIVPLPNPQRFLDTRIGLGAPLGRVPGLSVLPVPLAGSYGIPADASAVIVNATEVDPIADGFLTVAPCIDYGEGVVSIASGGTSTLNFTTGEIVPNLVVSSVDAGGRLCFYSTVHADLVADVAAYVPAGSQGLVMLSSPRRVVDTRFGQGSPAVPLDSTVRRVEFVDIGGNRVVPTDATAAIVNLTATRGLGSGYVTAFPCDQPAPLASNLNFAVGENVANMAIVKLAPGAQLCLRSMVPVDVIVDVSGYITGGEAFVPLAPSRLYDSREGIDPPCGFAVRFRGPTKDTQTFELVSTVDGSTFEIPSQPSWTAALSSSIDVFCDVWLLGVVAGSQVLYRYSLDDDSPTVVAQGSARGVAASAFGPILLSSFGGADGGDLFDVSDGVHIALPPNPVNEFGAPTTMWRLVGVTDDASLIVVERAAENNRAEVAYYDGDDGHVLATFKLAPATLVVDISPDGAYLAVIDNWLEGGPLSLTVMTLDGTPIAHLDHVYGAHFTSAGSLAICYAPPPAEGRAMRWDLFSSPTSFGGDTPLGCDVLDVR